MITVCPCAPGSHRLRRQKNGFTLVEIMMGTALSVFILAGALAAFLFMGRTEVNIQNYNDMEAEARHALDVFAEDARPASAVTWNNRNSITLTVNSAPVTYTYDDVSHTFLRRDGVGAQTLVRGIKDGSFAIRGYTVAGTAITAFLSEEDLIAASRSTKQLDISFDLLRSHRPTVTATDAGLSARFILRNKVAAQ